MLWLIAILSAHAGWTWRGPPLAEGWPGWRGTVNAQCGSGFDAIRDPDGTLWVALWEPANQVISVWRNPTADARWHRTRQVPAPRVVLGKPRVSLVRDRRGHHWLAWRSGHHEASVVEVATGAVRAIPLPKLDPHGLEDLDLTAYRGSVALLVAGFREDLDVWVRPVEEPAWRWLGAGDELQVVRADGRVAWTLFAWTEGLSRVVATWPPTVRRPAGELYSPVRVPGRSGWHAGEDVAYFASSGRGPWLSMQPDLKYASYHYGGEMNRLEIQRGSQRLAPAGQPNLQIPFGCSMEQIRLLTGEPPILFVGVQAVLRWTGEDWWALGADPAPSGGWGTPEVASAEPWFEGAVLRWGELNEEVGLEVWEVDLGDPQPVVHRPPQLESPDRWMASRGAGHAWVLEGFGGTWDRVSTMLYGPTWSRHIGVLGDRGIELVVPPRYLEAVATQGTELWAIAGRPWRVYRGTQGLQRELVLPQVSDRARGYLLDTTPPVVAFTDAHAGDVSVVSLFARDEGGWSVLREGASLVAQQPRSAAANRSDHHVVGVRGEDGQLWIAWERWVERKSSIGVATYTQEGWALREAGLDSAKGRAPALFVHDGAPVLGWRTFDGAVHVARWTGDAWAGQGLIRHRGVGGA